MGGLIVVATLAIILIVLWIQQFVVLMHLSDSQFAGRSDKILWVVAFVIVFWLAPITFIVWRNSNDSSGSVH